MSLFLALMGDYLKRASIVSNLRPMLQTKESLVNEIRLSKNLNYNCGIIDGGIQT